MFLFHVASILPSFGFCKIDSPLIFGNGQAGKCVVLALFSISSPFMVFVKFLFVCWLFDV